MANRYNITFDTEAEYTSYKASTAYCEPNVSYIKETNGVAYNPIDPYKGHDYVEIGGLKWATMNVGATSITDTGLYFQWGDTQGYTASQVGSGAGQKYFGWEDYKWTNDGGSTFTKYNGSDYTVLQSEDDAVQAAWGGNWRMPTTTELQRLGNAVNTAWTQVNGVSGMMCTDKTDETKTLFFPACGYADHGSVNNVGSIGFYWSSSLNADYGDRFAYILNFSDGDVSWDTYGDRFSGFPVRGVVG